MITSTADLRRLYPQASPRSRAKQLDRLDETMQRFIAHAPFCMLASAGAQGALVDASPRGGLPGFVQLADARTLLIPDATGNNRLDTLENLIADPRIGVLFLIPGVNEVLRVNGRAVLRDEAEFVERFAKAEARKLPTLVIEVAVHEAYLHCPKALMRSRLWSADAQVERAVLPTLGQMIHDQMGLATEPESQVAMLQRYRAQMAQEQQLGDA